MFSFEGQLTPKCNALRSAGKIKLVWAQLNFTFLGWAFASFFHYSLTYSLDPSI